MGFSTHIILVNIETSKWFSSEKKIKISYRLSWTTVPLINNFLRIVDAKWIFNVKLERLLPIKWFSSSSSSTIQSTEWFLYRLACVRASHLYFINLFRSVVRENHNVKWCSNVFRLEPQEKIKRMKICHNQSNNILRIVNSRVFGKQFSDEKFSTFLF